MGSVHEDFAVEATAGDIFLLGTHSWRVVKVETGTVRVHDAGDLPPTIPFWLGEAPARTAELSAEVGALRAELEPLLAAGDGDGARAGGASDWPGCPKRWPTRWWPTWAPGLAALGALPTRDRIVIERVFDESEGTQLIVHSPYGGRINRALGLALRKRFCVSFDFELQAAADDDTVVLSLGPQHSFPLTQVPTMLHSGTVDRRPDPGRAAPSDAGRPVALEPQPGPGGAPLAWRPAPPHPPPAHGGRRPAGRRLAGAGRLSGERRSRSGAGPRPRAGPPDGRRLPDRAARRRRPGRPARRSWRRAGSASTWSSRPRPPRWPTAS